MGELVVNFDDSTLEILADKIVQRMRQEQEGAESCSCAFSHEEKLETPVEKAPPPKITLEQMQNAAAHVAEKLGDPGPVKVLIAEYAPDGGTLKGVDPGSYLSLLEKLDVLAVEEG